MSMLVDVLFNLFLQAMFLRNFCRLNSINVVFFLACAAFLFWFFTCLAGLCVNVYKLFNGKVYLLKKKKKTLLRVRLGLRFKDINFKMCNLKHDS